MNGFLNAVTWLRGLIGATLRARPRVKVWEWMDAHVTIPDESGGPHPGQMQSRRFPVFRGLCDLAQLRTTRFFALCASARVGKTLFSIGFFLYWIAERVGNVVWLDPSGQSAKKFVRSELELFLQKCPAVWRLAVVSKTTWTTLWKTFRGKVARILGSGAEADLHGFNAELAIINEKDRCRDATSDDASSAEKIIARTKLFTHTRLVLENSTPGVAGEFSPIWRSFLRGSQHYCYVPCPHCSEDARKGNLEGGKAGKKGAKGKAGGAVNIQRPTSNVQHPSDAAAGEGAAVPVGWSEQSMEPNLRGWQRLTFSSEKKLVPFDEELRPLIDEATGKVISREKWREETTGQLRFEQFAEYEDRVSPHDATRTERVKVGYDLEAVERGTTYQCACCGKDIAHVQLRWMLARYRWVSHNPAAPIDRISAHIWAAYSPFEVWGFIAKEFLEAKHDVALLIKWFNFTLGLPFIRQGAAVKEDDLDRVVARTPIRYVKGQLPLRPEILAMTVDKQETSFWFVIRAYGVMWDHPEQPTWSALVDWGQAHSYDELLELAGLRPSEDGHLRRFVFVDPRTGERTEHHVISGLMDSGFEAEKVYEFCARNSEVFSPYKGATAVQTRGNKVRITKVLDEQVDLLLCWSDFFAGNLYYDCIKYGQAFGTVLHWWLPTDLDPEYKKQLTDEFQGPDGWTTRTKNNHLGDAEKEQRVLVDTIEGHLNEVREMRNAEIAAAAGKG